MSTSMEQKGIAIFCVACLVILLPLGEYILQDGIVEPDDNLIWHDEFDGNALNLDKWENLLPGPRRDAVNTPKAVRLDGNGHLVISTYIENDTTYTGMISTRDLFKQKYGYFETRALLQKQGGHWSAFWINSPTYGTVIGDLNISGAEVDIFEYRAHYPGYIEQTVHWDGYGADHKKSVSGHTQENLTDGWHTFGLEWTNESYSFFIDGNKTWQTYEGISHTPQFIILSLEVGPWAGGDIENVPLPDSILFDYVRVYKTRPGNDVME